MKNNKGFTLVELLAVIAILAILVIIALPNVLKMFNDAKKNSFLTETKTIYSEVSKKYISETMKGNKLTYISSEDDTKLEMTGRDLQYCVLLNTDGSVKSMKVSNGEWIAELPSGKKITDLKNTDLKDVPSGYKFECKASTSQTPLPAVSFDKDSWEVIASNAKNCVNNEENCPYKVGNTKTVKVNGNEFTVRLANLKAPETCDKNDKNNYDEFFSQSACGFVVEFADVIDSHVMNSTNTNVGGWQESGMRKYLNNDIYNSLENELKKVISKVAIRSGHGSTSGEKDFITEDYLYLLSTAEIWENGTSNTISTDTARNYTRQLDYYEGVTIESGKYSKAIKNNSAGSASWWWLRSATSSTYNYFCIVNNYGGWSNIIAGTTYGVSPAFRIG